MSAASIEPQPLQPVHDLHKEAGHLMRRAHQRAAALFGQEARAFDVTGPQYVVLVALALQPGLEQSRVAEMVDLDRWTTGDILARLERRGLVLREVDMTDRRCRRLLLTAAGQRVVRRLEPVGLRVHDRLLAPLDAAERTEFLRLLRKLLGVAG